MGDVTKLFMPALHLIGGGAMAASGKPESGVPMMIQGLEGLSQTLQAPQPPQSPFLQPARPSTPTAPQLAGIQAPTQGPQAVGAGMPVGQPPRMGMITPEQAQQIRQMIMGGGGY